MRIALILALLTVVGCSTAGPFVTSVSSNWRGGIVVEKCSITLNQFTSTISNKDCHQSQIQLR